jgi:phosphosulfolactate phosphohydrolase-like enzyme
VRPSGIRPGPWLGASIGIVCAGRRGGFAIDDALTAGYLVDRCSRRAATPSSSPRRPPRPPAVASTPDIGAAFRASISGQLLVQHDLEADLAYCLDAESSSVVPVLVRDVPARLERFMA